MKRAPASGVGAMIVDTILEGGQGYVESPEDTTIHTGWCTAFGFASHESTIDVLPSRELHRHPPGQLSATATRPDTVKPGRSEELDTE